MVCVKRLRERFPVEVVKAAVLFGVQALGYDQPTEEQMHILRAFFFVGSDVSPVFLPGMESICAMLPYRQLLDTYDLLEVFLAHIVLGIGHERRIHELANESPNSFVCKFARVELSALFHCYKYCFVSQMLQRIHIHARLSAIIWPYCV